MLKTEPTDQEYQEWLAWEKKEHEAAFKLDAARVIAPFTLHLIFADCQKIIDFRPFLFHPDAKPMYFPLRDPDYFAQVKVEDHLLTWPNHMDFNPAMVYFWDELAADRFIRG